VAPVANQLVLGGPPECPNREFCALGLKNKYGINFKDFKALDTGGPITVQALVGGQIDVGLLFTSDATIAVRGFVLLEDDKQLQLSDNVAPVVRNDYLSKAGDGFKTLINSIAPKLTTAELTAMNKQVEIDKTDPKDVAKAWLKKVGLIK
jgi:osmoprotectant transport system substrate-binding protein